MAGGFGTRLRPLTAHLPKPVVPVGNIPIMEHMVRLLKRHGFTDLSVLLYFLPDSITSYFGDGGRWGVKLTYVTPTADLGTAGAVKFAVGDADEPVLVVSADVLTDIDLAGAVAFHRARGAEATMVLTRVEQPLAYGIVITDEEGRVLRFLEKPSWGEVFSDTINTGIYLLEPSVFPAIPAGRSYDFGKELFPALLASGRSRKGTRSGSTRAPAWTLRRGSRAPSSSAAGRRWRREHASRTRSSARRPSSRRAPTSRAASSGTGWRSARGPWSRKP